MDVTVTHQFHPDRRAYWPNYLIGIIILISSVKFGLIALGVGMLLLALTEIARTTVIFYILENGVAKEFKFFATHRIFTDYGKIQNLTVKQSLMERILGTGEVAIDTAGNQVMAPEIVFFGLKDAHAVEKMIRDNMGSSAKSNKEKEV